MQLNPRAGDGDALVGRLAAALEEWERRHAGVTVSLQRAQWYADEACPAGLAAATGAKRVAVPTVASRVSEGRVPGNGGPTAGLMITTECLVADKPEEDKKKSGFPQPGLQPGGGGASPARFMGYHRDTFYELRRAFLMGGVAAP